MHVITWQIFIWSETKDQECIPGKQNVFPLQPELIWDYMISFSGSYDNILDRYRSDFVPWTGLTGFCPTMPMEAVLDVL